MSDNKSSIVVSNIVVRLQVFLRALSSHLAILSKAMVARIDARSTNMSFDVVDILQIPSFDKLVTKPIIGRTTPHTDPCCF
ncbi:hypothetical protein LCGC14_0869960 [marine sediment metagenome]|uniref:Uncharacterized protein n=1 Tax=marine sediment metagenome TaxID=412755 RepID=A0A0F9P9V4_9ZZZZ